MLESEEGAWFFGVSWESVEKWFLTLFSSFVFLVFPYKILSPLFLEAHSLNLYCNFFGLTWWIGVESHVSVMFYFFFLIIIKEAFLILILLMILWFEFILYVSCYIKKNVFNNLENNHYFLPINLFFSHCLIRNTQETPNKP